MPIQFILIHQDQLVLPQRTALNTSYVSISQLFFQNGNTPHSIFPDRLAMIQNGDTATEFLSYEGTFTAMGGVANNVASTNIGVSETDTTPIGR